MRSVLLLATDICSAGGCHISSELLRHSSYSYKPPIRQAENTACFTVAWCHSLAWRGVYRASHRDGWVGVCYVTRTSCCAIQAFTELSRSNAPIQSTTLLLCTCPKASVAQQLLHRANTPHYIPMQCLIPILKLGIGDAKGRTPGTEDLCQNGIVDIGHYSHALMLMNEPRLYKERFFFLFLI
jgi:hypothetical protein